ncbi:MAG: hypothetical protein DI598_11265 [Pseudopedobacter saltans]|uniref:Uncharacterized protein n=1 Tax=Pseudopedobacter saltans TaxID=151895 RepID=A0A2W5EYZ8_9SPHI|nr:MAG: hypothetical protein DI598_11265 [Pseudopedobacter saltans]
MDAQAQVFGGNPLSTRWQQMGNDTFNIIFPSNKLETARQIAWLIRWQSKNNNNIGQKVKKVNIVLQADVTYSNGYVGLGPFRSEFYLMPPTDPFSLGSQLWPSNLAIHEYRHVQQYNNFNVGLSKTVGTIFGENGRALFNAMSVPDWFFEGDAVYNETRLSNQGRGRFPLFMNDFAALLLDKKKYSYQKIRNGSYNDYVPNHYSLGYILVAYGYEKYGNDFWEKVTHDAASFKSILYPWQSAIKKYTGISFKQFTENAFQYYERSLPADTLSPVFLTKKKKNNVINYEFPIVSDDNTIAVKTSYKSIPQFVAVDSSGKEKKVATQSISYDDYFSANDKEIVYSSLKADPRWGNRQYSNVRILNKLTGNEKKIGNRTKWFTPDISSTGDSLLVMKMSDEGNKSAIQLINREGLLLKNIAEDSSSLFTYPKFFGNGCFVFVRNEKGEMSIRYYHFEKKGFETILDSGNRLLGYPSIKNDTLYFNSSSKGKDALWAYVPKSKQIFDVATYPTGIYGGAEQGDRVVGSVFTSAGRRLAKISSSWVNIENVSVDTLRPLYFNLENPEPVLDKISMDTTLSISKYKRWTHPFNFHSLQPDWDDPNYTFSLYGESVLGTVQSELYYNYNRNEKYSAVGFSSVYGGWFLMPVINVSQTFNRQVQQSNGNILKWNELNGNIGLRLPLNYTSGKMYRYLTLQSTVNTNYIQWQGNASKIADNKTFNYWSNQLSFSTYSQQASQQIYPHLGLAMSTLYRTGITAKAYQWLTVGNIYLPGLVNTHSLVVNGAYMMRDTIGNYNYSNGFPISRGYSLISYPRMWKLGANYHFPIVYPDWGFGNIVYFLRIRGNAFYDYSSVKSLRYQRSYHLRSVGGEIYFDTKWWNQESVTFGIRYSNMIDHKLMGTGANRWEFILPIGLFK